MLNPGRAGRKPSPRRIELLHLLLRHTVGQPTLLTAYIHHRFAHCIEAEQEQAAAAGLEEINRLTTALVEKVAARGKTNRKGAIAELESLAEALDGVEAANLATQHLEALQE